MGLELEMQKDCKVLAYNKEKGAVGRVLKAAQQEMSIGSVTMQFQLSGLFLHFTASKKKAFVPS